MDATQIILIVFIVLLIIIYPIMMFSKNKKENQRMLEQTNSLKRGDKVLTTSGVYGTIVDLQLQDDKKIVTIETGTDKKKGYISVDAYAIYQIFKDEETKEPESVETLTTAPATTEETPEETQVVEEEKAETVEQKLLLQKKWKLKSCLLKRKRSQETNQSLNNQFKNVLILHKQLDKDNHENGYLFSFSVIFYLRKILLSIFLIKGVNHEIESKDKGDKKY